MRHTCILLASVLAAANVSFAQLAINEIDYDQPSTDTAEFIEIRNDGASAVDLTGHALRLYNGGVSPVALYREIALPGSLLAPGAYLVVCGNAATVFPCDVDTPPDTDLVQNGAPDAVALVNGSTVLDVVSYEGNTVGFTEASGVGLEDVPDAGKSIGRCPDGVDTNQNNVDFLFVNATPGAANACPPPPTPAAVVINEVDSDTPGTDAAEFIELFGPPNAPLDGLAVVLFNGSAVNDASYAAFDLDGFATDAEGFFVLGNTGVPEAQILFAGNVLQNGQDAVALYAANAEDFPNGTAATDLNLRDAVVYDTADADDTVLLGILTPGQPQVDEAGGGDSASDAIARVPNGGAARVTSTYVAQEPTPGESNEPPPPPPIGVCGEAATPIHAVQGSGFDSPLAGMIQVVEGVVVADFQGSNRLGGFFLQEEDTQIDADPATSEGIFVFDGTSLVDVQAGDVVRVGGTVTEFFGLTEISGLTGIAVCSSGTGGASAATVLLPMSAAGELEKYEGMLVRFPQELFVTGNFTQGRFGEVDLSVGGRLYIPTALVSPGAPAVAQKALNDRSRILLDDGSNVQNPLPLPPYLGPDGTLRAGDRTSNLEGALSFGFSAYRLQPTVPVAFERLNARPSAAPAVGGTLKIASFNVLNYFTTLDDGSGPICGPTGGLDCRGANSAVELERQRAKILDALTALSADVFGLIELENNASEAAADLVEGLNDAVGAGTYDFVDTGTIGTDAIKVALLYKPGKVAPVGATATLENVFPFNVNTRPPLAQAFEENATGRRFVVVVNHFKSKGSACDSVFNPDTGSDFIDPDTGDGQGNCNLTRVEAANRLLEWLATDPTGTGIDRVLVLGDLNAYTHEDPIGTLEAGGFTNLVDRFLGPGAYSFVFAGESGYLDHALASPAILPFVRGVAEWHINADEPVALDYNNEFNQPLLFHPDRFRSADHDPVVVGLDLQPMRQVRIDIRPFFPENIILNSASIEPVGVAILSESDFDARRVDPRTVRFGRNGASPVLPAVFVDVNQDSRKDMLLVFLARSTGITCGDTAASLNGFTFDGTKIAGSDSVRVIRCRR